ncbi:unnamed protein product [Effrenium voratum]|uniref:Uncharacterized protein n=1 Tax=Effrenium voratum TaxID=2562239 RepID=A0AA36N544_9DINO|nr:unnamed protein product [Effrenium voratum]
MSERQRVRLREEIKDGVLLLGKGFRSRLHVPEGATQGPQLLALEPVLDDEHERPHQQYRAHLQLRQEQGIHAWSTEPFTLDELLRIVVRTRAASAKQWCLADRQWRAVFHDHTATFSDFCWTLAKVALCAAGRPECPEFRPGTCPAIHLGNLT